MRIGLFAGTTPETTYDLAGLVAFAKDVEARGFDDDEVDDDSDVKDKEV